MEGRRAKEVVLGGGLLLEHAPRLLEHGGGVAKTKIIIQRHSRQNFGLWRILTNKMMAYLLRYDHQQVKIVFFSEIVFISCNQRIV